MAFRGNARVGFDWFDRNSPLVLVDTSQQIGGAIGVAVGTTIATTFTNRYVGAHVGASALGGGALTHGFQVTFYVLAVIGAVGAVAAAVLTESHPSVPDAADVEGEPLREAA